jgi:hypothetical protein
MVERGVWDAKAAGSSPATQTESHGSHSGLVDRICNPVGQPNREFESHPVLWRKNEMKVYVLAYHRPYEGQEIIDVFASHEAAFVARSKLRPRKHAEITEFEVKDEIKERQAT